MDDRREQRIREIVRDELAELQSGGGQGADEPPGVGRRGVLASLAAAASLGAGGYYAVSPVLADTHSGEVGTPNKLQRVWAETIRDSGDSVVIDVENGEYYTGGNNALIDVAASGSVALSSGSATVTIETASGSTYYLALGTDDNAKVSGRIFDDGSVKVEIVETDTSVGNPTVNYDVLRVR
jgi:flagellar hook assembly protein FlgD